VSCSWTYCACMPLAGIDCCSSNVHSLK
jgi:hypothetical protein